MGAKPRPRKKNILLCDLHQPYISVFVVGEHKVWIKFGELDWRLHDLAAHFLYQITWKKLPILGRNPRPKEQNNC